MTYYYAVLHAEHTAAASTATTGVDLQRSRHLIDNLVDLTDYVSDDDASAALDAAEGGDADAVFELVDRGGCWVVRGTLADLVEWTQMMGARERRYDRLAAGALRDLLGLSAPQSLEELAEILRRDSGDDDPAASARLAAEYGLPVSQGILDWTSLPTFGGAYVDGSGVWSWNADSVLIGSCADDVRIVARSELHTKGER